MASSASLDELQRKFDEYPRRYLAPLANEYRKAGALDRAIELCRSHLPDYPEHLSGYVVFGQALYEAGELEEATAVFDTALGLDPENLIALRHMGDIARDRGDRAGARDWYERVLEADPRNEEIALALQQLDAAPDGEVRTPSARSETPAHGFGAAHVQADAGATSDASNADAESFDPGFFATADVLDAAPGATPSAPVAAVHDVDPTELALAAALDTPLVPDDAPPARDAAPFDFLASAAPADEADVAPAVHDSQDVAFEPGFESGFAAGDDSPFGMTQDEPRGVDAVSSDFGIERSGDGSEFLDNTATTSAGWSTDATSNRPAYGHGFDVDALFDDQTEAPSTVTPPADIGLESMEFVPPAREDADAAHTPSASASPFVTETMAELYLQQGFRDEALEVYEQLLEANPRDQNLRGRIEQLRGGAASTLGGAPDADQPLADDVHAVSAAQHEPVNAMQDATDSATVADAASEATARAFFLSLARMEGSADAGTPDAEMPTDEEPAAADAPAAEHVEPSSSADVEPATHEETLVAAEVPNEAHRATPAANDSLAGLLGGTPDRADEDAAATLATLFGGGTLHHASAGSEQTADVPVVAPRRETPAFDQAPVRSATPHASQAVGSPARPAARDLSLDDVFGAPVAPARSTPGASFSFDQFFADTPAPGAATPARGVAAQESAPAAPPAPAAPAATDDAGDLAQFNAWLEGLKKR